MTVFLEVCRNGSFRQAALALSLNPSAVTHHVRKLEEQLGFELYRRDSGRLVLTEYGRQVEREFAGPFSRLDRDFTRTRKLGEGRARTVKLTFASGVGTRNFYEFLARFSRDNPDIVLELNANDARENIDDTENDIAIRIGWPQTQATGRIIPLRTLRSVTCCSRLYARQESVKNFADLERCTWVYMRALPFPIAYQHKGEPATISPHRILFVNTSSMAYDLVYNSVGVSTLLDLVIEDDMAWERLEILFPDHELPYRQLFLGLRSGREDNPDVLTVAESLQNHFTRQAPAP
ncbi:MAG: LysR family transcriptional regulator [Rhizobiaceae bacterium]